MSVAKLLHSEDVGVFMLSHPSSLLPLHRVAHCVQFFFFFNETLNGAMEHSQIKGCGFTILTTR